MEPYLVAQGFRRLRNDDYYHAEDGILLEDLHDENVLLVDGQLAFIDPVIYFETKDMKLAGKSVYGFPFGTHQP